MNPWNWIRPVRWSVVCRSCDKKHRERAWRWVKYVSINKVLLTGWQWGSEDGFRCPRCAAVRPVAL